MGDHYVWLPNEIARAEEIVYKSKWEVPNIRDIAVKSHGNVYASDRDQIVKFANSGAFITSWPATSQNVSFNSKENFVLGIAVDSLGNVYVAEDYSNKLKIYGWNLHRYLGISGMLKPKYDIDPGINGIVVDANTSLYVADNENDRIEKFNRISWHSCNRPHYYSPFASQISFCNNIMKHINI